MPYLGIRNANPLDDDFKRIVIFTEEQMYMVSHQIKGIQIASRKLSAK